MARVDTEQQRKVEVQRVLIVEMLLNLCVASAKASYGVWSGSLAILSDAVHSGVDAGANVVGLVAVRAASAPPDSDHPYGHRKMEIVAATGIGIAVGIGAIEFGWGAVVALWEGRPAPQASAVGFVVLGGTWVVNIFVALWERQKARQLQSAYLLADAAHTATDVVVTAGVFLSYTASYFGVSWADPFGAILVVAVMARVAYEILRSNLQVLVDGAVVDVAQVKAIADGLTGVTDCHRVRSRGPAGAVQVDLHLLVDGDLPLHQAHDVAHEFESRLRQEFPEVVDVTIHIEPDDDDEESL